MAISSGCVRDATPRCTNQLQKSRLCRIIASDWCYESEIGIPNPSLREAALPFIELLHFGTGTQAVHYFLFCLVAVLGTLQAVAARYQNCDLLWFEGRVGYLLGMLAVAGGFAWFFLVDEEIFTPGLAGSELFIVFAGASLAALVVTRIVAFALNRLRSGVAIARVEREKETLS